MSSGISQACSATSPELSGDFGPSTVVITSVTASDPDTEDSVYSNGDTITIDFNEDTNRAYFCNGGVPGSSTVCNQELSRNEVNSTCRKYFF